jgi:hypothetical protein
MDAIRCMSTGANQLSFSTRAHIFKTDGSADLSAMSASSAFKLLIATKDALQEALQKHFCNRHVQIQT